MLPVLFAELLMRLFVSRDFSVLFCELSVEFFHVSIPFASIPGRTVNVSLLLLGIFLQYASQFLALFLQTLLSFFRKALYFSVFRGNRCHCPLFNG
jgi:hypothetical protein